MDGPLGRPTRIAVGGHGVQLSGEFSSVALVRERAVHGRAARFSHDCGCIVAGRMPSPDKTLEHSLHFLEPGTAGGLVHLHDGQEMDS